MSATDQRALTEEEQRRVAELMRRWLERARIALSAYNDATTRTLSAERRLGVPAVILGAIVATSVFATVKTNPSLFWRIVTGGLAVAAAVLTALQTFLRQAERAEQYREAARSYGRIRRRIEHEMLFPPRTVAEAQSMIEELSEALADAAHGKPNLPQRIWDRAEFKIRQMSDARGFRALTLRLRDRLQFGVGEQRPEALPEDHELYFSGLESTIVVPVAKVEPTRSAASQPSSVATARERMREAAAGTRERRSPLDVREDSDGRYVIVDGNATFAIAQADGWDTVPVRVLTSNREAEVAKPREPLGAAAERQDGKV